MKIYGVREYQAGSGWIGKWFYYTNKEAAEKKAEMIRAKWYDAEIVEIEVKEEAE